MTKYPYGLTLQAVCDAIDAYRDKEDDVPEAGMIAAFEILLAAMDKASTALTAQPVKLPKGFSPGIGDIFDKTAPVMRRDASDGKWLHKADVTKILNELGYEVQE